jgi:hypothetical protein
MKNPFAFPFPAFTYPNGEINHGEGGMTLRDYFAAKAMQGLFANGQVNTTAIVKSSYMTADAMMKAREA